MRKIKILKPALMFLMMITQLIGVCKAYEQNNNAEFTVNIHPQIFNVSVPTQLKIVSDKGHATKVGKLFVENKSLAPVQIKSIQITPANGWSIESAS